MKFSEEYNRVVGELLDEERQYHRRANGTVDHEACARAVVERMVAEYPDMDTYQRDACPVSVAETKSKSRDNSPKAQVTAIGEDEAPKDMRMFISIGPGQYLYYTEASVGQIEEEISRRQGKLNADRTALEQLIWSADVARRLGADTGSRMGDYIKFSA